MIVPVALLTPLAALVLGMIAPEPGRMVAPDAATNVEAEIMPPSDADDKPRTAIAFRRILVPADRMRDWPLGADRYLPMDAREFERLAALLAPRGKTPPTPPAALAVAARHEARLEGDRLLGRSELDVAIRGSAPARLNLSPCNMAVEKAFWQPENGKHNDIEADLGLGDEGTLQARVERPGTLAFDWSLRGKRGPGDGLLFVLELPPAAAACLILELPKELLPAADRGLTLENTPTSTGAIRWRIALGGGTRLRLRIAAATASEAGRPLAFLREARTYDCSPRGLELSAQWKLQVHDEPLSQIAVLLDPGLQLLSARLGEEPIAWAVAGNDAGATRIILQLPEPIVESERVLRLTAIGRSPVAETRRLPRIRAEGLAWQEGAIVLLIPDPLTTERMLPIDCVQTGVGALSPPRSGRSAQFQCHHPDATVELRLAGRRPELQTLSTAQVELSMQGAVARQTVDCRVADGALLSIQGEVSPRWLIESVESAPTGRVSDWTVETTTGGGRRLTVNLAGFPVSRQPVRLEIVARRPADEKSAKLAIGELPPVVFPRTQGSKQLLSLVAGDGLDIELAGRRRPKMLRAEELTPAEQELFGQRPAGLLFECDETNNRVQLAATARVSKSPPRNLDANDEPEKAWILREQLHSWYLTDGRARHVADFAVQHAGRQELRLVLSPRLGQHPEEIQATLIDGQPTKHRVNVEDGRTMISLDLPEKKSGISRATLEWIETGTKLGLWGARSISPPTADLPALARDWTLHLPADYAAVGCGGDAGDNIFYPPLGDGPARFHFMRRSAERLTAAAVFLVVMMLGLWRREALANVLLTAVLLACATWAAVLPGELLSPALSGVLAAAICLAWRRVRRFVRPTKATCSGDGQAAAMPSQPSIPGGEGSTVFATLFAACLALAADGSVRAADYQVFVPIDDQRRPSGDMVYLPEAFYRELLRFEPQSAAGQWLIASATYRGEITRQPSSGRLGIGVLRGQFDLRVFERGTTVTLPGGGDISGGGVLLDGLPIEPLGPSAAGKTTLRINEPGRYRLEYPIRVIARNDGTEGGFEAVVPRTPTARLELTLPDGAPTIDVPAALGPLQRGDDPWRVSAQLAPTDRLAVTWPEEAGGSVAAQVEAEQLVWLKVHPGSVLVAARFKFHVREGQLSQVRLSIDSRLRLLPLSGNNPPEVRLGAETGQTRVLSIRWPRPVAERTVLEIAMLLGGASGVGNIPMPKVELLEPRPARRWMAASVDDSLEYEQQRDQRLEATSPADFLRVWGAAEPGPKFAYRLGENPSDWFISTRPRQPRGEARQSLQVVPDGDGAVIRYEARYQPRSGYVFQHRLKVPKELQIESVSAIEKDVQHMHHWSREEDGAITIFLDEPAAGEQKIVVRGRSETPAARRWKADHFRLEQCDLHNDDFVPPPDAERTTTDGGAAAWIDAAVAWQEGGRFLAAAAIVAEPGEAEELILQMPPRCELLRAETVAGDGSRRPLDLHADNGELNLCKSPLGKQRIELTYRGEGIGPDRAGRLRLQAPTLMGAAVRRTRWIVASPPGWTIEGADNGATFSSWEADERLGALTAGGDETRLISSSSTTELRLDCRCAGTNGRPSGWVVAAAALAVLAAMVLSRPCGNIAAIQSHRRSAPAENE
jgi:hypothetical protein